MSDTSTLKPEDIVIFGRDCETTQIPSGARVVVPKDTEAHVGQTLGGNITLRIPAFGLVQVQQSQLDALFKDGVPVVAPPPSAAVAPEKEGPADEKEIW